jgi:hypothetical protein
VALPIVLKIAADPTLIKGIYDMCDRWCMYCRVTERCFAFRCNPAIQSGNWDTPRSVADSLHDGILLLKQQTDAEGTTPPEIDAMLSDDPRDRVRRFEIEIDDPIERIGARYAHLSEVYLHSRPDYPFELKPRSTGPTPLEVFAWFHALVSAKVYRALVSAAHRARGDKGRKDDALKSAKVALIGMDRSLDALSALAAEDDDPRLELLRSQLQRLRREVEGRFPDARAYVRPGLDAPLSD